MHNIEKKVKKELKQQKKHEEFVESVKKLEGITAPVSEVQIND